MNDYKVVLDQKSKIPAAHKMFPILFFFSLLFSACAPGSLNNDLDPEQTKTTEATQLRRVETGDEFTATELKEVFVGTNQHAYSLKDGTIIIVGAEHELPEKVLAEFVQELTTFTNASSEERGNKLMDLLSKVSRTGKKPVVVWRNLKESSNPNSGWEWLVSYPDPQNRFQLIHLARSLSSQSKAIAAANNFVQSQEDFATWAIISAETP